VFVHISYAQVPKSDTTNGHCPSRVVYGGKSYNTIKIGMQCWLKENLDVGTMIAGTTEQSNNSTLEKYCYDNDTANCSTYGGFYEWNEAMQYTTSSDAQGICPTGWHIPTNGEFQTLQTTVGNDGNALKAVGQDTGGGAGTNTSGFFALLSGYRLNLGYFLNVGYYTTFWSSTEYDATYVYYLALYYNNSYIYFNIYNKAYGFSVRCLEN